MSSSDPICDESGLNEVINLMEQKINISDMKDVLQSVLRNEDLKTTIMNSIDKHTNSNGMEHSNTSLPETIGNPSILGGPTSSAAPSSDLIQSILSNPNVTTPVFEAMTPLLNGLNGMNNKNSSGRGNATVNMPSMNSMFKSILNNPNLMQRITKMCQQLGLEGATGASFEELMAKYPNLPDLLAQSNINIKEAFANTKTKKVPPNSPCPCGSSKKYKKCCFSKE
ncbi:MAG: hypothetical protein Sylvanvirus20_6 [Sylvanvirus sp.]|uniref:Uncharacterized protein n=1 Tax=Sylvanvirus sp. TaxID=2487774 RepID=A0A3G5AIM9_9VIRU|nr:MAG: hypothetical protein Sylvanvirus20_6 [Sylvanvirus sp.]